MSHSHTWPDGTPKSQSNAFTIQPRPVAPTNAEKHRARSKARYDLKLFAEGRTRLDVERDKVTRVNKHIDLQAHCGLTMGQRAAR